MAADEVRCGKTKRHTAHWWGVDKDTDYWCDGRHYEKGTNLIEEPGKEL